MGKDHRRGIVPGKPGETEKLTYHVADSNSADDSSGFIGMSDSPNDNITLDLPITRKYRSRNSTYRSMQWFKYKGDDGHDGAAISIRMSQSTISQPKRATGITVNPPGGATTSRT